MGDPQYRKHIERGDGPAVIAFRNDNPAALDETEWHTHLRGQFFYLESGMITLRTESGAWTLPPHRAGWMPPGLMHTVRISGPISGWGVFITPQAARDLPERPCVVGAGGLLRALVWRAVSWADQNDLDARQQRVLDLLLDEIREAPVQQLHLPMPTDRRLQRIVDQWLLHPDDDRTLEAWADAAGLSARTLSRLFRQETGCTFAQWRQQARLTHALEQLAKGTPVASVADALGYASPSAFIAMFRRCIGQSPMRYLNSGRVVFAGT